MLLNKVLPPSWQFDSASSHKSQELSTAASDNTRPRSETQTLSQASV
jgi:hypothetical protein